jgi:hypothetical protein
MLAVVRAHCPQVTVPILRAGNLAQEFCQSVARANVEAVFERCFYLRRGGEFICVGEPEIGNGPLTLIGNFGRLSDVGLRPGQSAAICARHIAIGPSIRLILHQTETWRRPPWPDCPSPPSLIEVCDALTRRAAIDAPEESLARHVYGAPEKSKPDAALVRIARSRVAVFERELFGVLDTKDAQARCLEEAIRGLIGLGPGLTPSGDDFFVGALALLDAIVERDAHAVLARAMREPLLKLTTPLSACFLRAATAGQVGEALHRAVSSVLKGEVDSAAAFAGKIGHSSGWDMMAGVITTLRVAATARLRAHHHRDNCPAYPSMRRAAPQSPGDRPARPPDYLTL